MAFALIALKTIGWVAVVATAPFSIAHRTWRSAFKIDTDATARYPSRIRQLSNLCSQEFLRCRTRCI